GLAGAPREPSTAWQATHTWVAIAWPLARSGLACWADAATAKVASSKVDSRWAAGFISEQFSDAKPADFTMPALGAPMTEQNPSSTPALPPVPDEKTALAWAHTARFLTTASRLDQLPATELPEIAFVGRSNAGKSTAINTLTQQKRLAFASKTPGRTQHINLFELGPK